MVNMNCCLLWELSVCRIRFYLELNHADDCDYLPIPCLSKTLSMILHSRRGGARPSHKSASGSDHAYRMKKYQTKQHIWLNAVSWTECYLLTCINSYYSHPSLYVCTAAFCCLINNDDDDDDNSKQFVLLLLALTFDMAKPKLSTLAKIADLTRCVSAFPHIGPHCHLTVNSTINTYGTKTPF